MTGPSNLTSLAGVLTLRPGRPPPHGLDSTRSDLAARFAPGRPAASLPALMGSLHGLCAGAHRLCATACLRMAREGRPPRLAFEVADLARLEAETLREHLRRVLLDWPGQLGDVTWQSRWAPEHQRALRRCGDALQAGAAGQSLEHWLAAEIFGLPPAAWLAAWSDDPQAWLDRWSCGPGWLPALLAGVAPSATWTFAPVPVLCLETSTREPSGVETSSREGPTLDAPIPVAPIPDAPIPDAPTLDSPVLADGASDELAALTLDLLEPWGRAGPRRPRWQGDCAETGVWARQRQARDLSLATPWLRFGARLAEIARLAVAGEAGQGGQGGGGRSGWLACGGVSLARDGVLAWVEMARGVLMHAVRLEGQGSESTIAACGVLAPTEWNFHPHGALARGLAGRDPDLSAAARRELDVAVLSLDPCVAYTVEGQSAKQWQAREPGHA